MTQHAMDRARERYGIELTEADLEAIRTQIDAGQSVMTARFNGSEHHLVEAAGRAGDQGGLCAGNPGRGHGAVAARQGRAE